MRASGRLVEVALIGLSSLFPIRPAAAAPGLPADDFQVLATVDGDPVTTRDLVILLGQQGVPSDPDDVANVSPDGLLKRLVQNRLLEHEGYRLGLDETPEVQGQVRDVLRHRGMMALLDSVSAQVPDPEPASTVEAAPIASRMFRVSHILVKTRAEAEALRDSLDAGAPFGDLAKRHSLDTEWAQPNGELGWAREDKFIPEFAAALQELTTGDVSIPVQTADGWHLLWLAESRTEALPRDGSMAEAERRSEKRERVMKVVGAYVESLKDKYGVVTNDSLLATLDYASEDPDVLRSLQSSEEVLARLPWRDLTVRQLTREIRFEHFHGLAGKPDAPQLRDRAFDEWITEMLLRHEAVELEFDKKPDIAASGEQMERETIREKVGKMILDIRFEPHDEEVEQYYRAHPEEFSPPPRVRATGVLLSGEDAARRFRQRLEAGAQLAWLAERTPEVVDTEPALFTSWLAPEKIGLADVPDKPGAFVGPFETSGSWAVARIVDVEERPPLPLDECRPRALALMKNGLLRDTMIDALARLEKAATIEVRDDAQDAVQGAINRWLAVGRRNAGSHGSLHGGAPHGSMSPGDGKDAAP